MSDRLHRIEVTIDTDGGIDAAIVCDAPEGASCRTWCDEGCEFGTSEHWENHTLRDQGYCTQVEGWFDDPFECYGGSTAPLRSGPVDLIWEGDYFTWRYADDKTGDNDE